MYRVEEADDVYYVNEITLEEYNVRNNFSPIQQDRLTLVHNELNENMREVASMNKYFYEFSDEWIKHNPQTWDDLVMTLHETFTAQYHKTIFLNKWRRFQDTKKNLIKKRIHLSQYRKNQLNKMRHIKQAL